MVGTSLQWPLLEGPHLEADTPCAPCREPASICMTRNDSLTIHLSDPTKFPFTSQQELLPNLAIGLTKGMP